MAARKSKRLGGRLAFAEKVILLAKQHKLVSLSVTDEGVEVTLPEGNEEKESRIGFQVEPEEWSDEEDETLEVVVPPGPEVDRQRRNVTRNQGGDRIRRRNRGGASPARIRRPRSRLR